MEPLQKTTFKQMHKNGELLLLGATSLTREAAADVVQAAIATENLPSGRQVNPGSYGNIDDRHHKCYIDEANGIVYLERLEVGDDWQRTSSHRPQPLTTVYKIA